MAGRIVPHWQKVVQDKYLEILDHPDYAFDYEIIADSLMDDVLFDLNIQRFVRKYNAPLGMINYLKVMFRTGIDDLNNVTPPLMLVSEVDSTVYPSPDPSIMMEAYRIRHTKGAHKRVYLELTANTLREDLDHFLDIYYDSLISKKLDMLDSNRLTTNKTRQQQRRFNEIAGLYRYKNSKGQKRGIHTDIATETGYTPRTIKSVIEEYRKQSQFTPLTMSEYLDLIGQQPTD